MSSQRSVNPDISLLRLQLFSAQTEEEVQETWEVLCCEDLSFKYLKSVVKKITLPFKIRQQAARFCLARKLNRPLSREERRLYSFYMDVMLPAKNDLHEAFLSKKFGHTAATC